MEFVVTSFNYTPSIRFARCNILSFTADMQDILTLLLTSLILEGSKLSRFFFLIFAKAFDSVLSTFK